MHKLLVANWKMYVTHHEAKLWLSENIEDLDAALTQTGNELVICPSYTDLIYLESYPTKNILLGAQDCSFEEQGAFTGDVSALSLAQLNCAYVILGHSERRSLYGDTNERIYKKAALALKYGLEPIICIGETTMGQTEAQTYQDLENQLTPMLDLLDEQNNITIAYEPVWSIGTRIIPPKKEIDEKCSWIRKFLLSKSNRRCEVLYGGSVDENTIKTIPIDHLDGLLIGKASIDAQVLKKIILSC